MTITHIPSSSIPSSMTAVATTFKAKVDAGSKLSAADIDSALVAANGTDGIQSAEAGFLREVASHYKDALAPGQESRLRGLAHFAANNENVFMPTKEGKHTVSGAAAAFFGMGVTERSFRDTKFVKGDTLPTDPKLAFIDRAATYRELSFPVATMQAHFGLSAEAAALMNRADSLNQPAAGHPDGRVNLDELVKLATQGALLPDERALLPALFEAMKTTPVAMVQTPTFSTTPFFMDRAEWPKQLVKLPTELAITEFPAAMQRDLQRAIIVHLGDSAPLTRITLATLQYAITTDFPESTPADREVWKKAIELFKPLGKPHRAAEMAALSPTYKAEATLVDALFDKETINLTQTEKLGVFAVRTPHVGGLFQTCVHYELDKQVEVPAGHKLMLIPENTARGCRGSYNENAAIWLGAGTHPLPASEGERFRAVLVKGGTVVEETELVNMKLVNGSNDDALNRADYFLVDLEQDFFAKTTSGKEIFYNKKAGESQWTLSLKADGPQLQKVTGALELKLPSGFYEVELTDNKGKVHAIQVSVLNEPNQKLGGAVQMGFGHVREAKLWNESSRKYASYDNKAGVYRERITGGESVLTLSRDGTLRAEFGNCGRDGSDAVKISLADRTG